MLCFEGPPNFHHPTTGDWYSTFKAMSNAAQRFGSRATSWTGQTQVKLVSNGVISRGKSVNCLRPHLWWTSCGQILLVELIGG